jgi:16S rRNA (adenine1518-N6/adenine1519-N6)-dimethyltransferase
VEFNFKKKFGQNFITYIPDEILFPINTLPNEIKTIFILEIGPGNGAITTAILEQISTFAGRTIHYHAVDVDKEALQATEQNVENILVSSQNLSFSTHLKDILTVSLAELYKNEDAIWIFGALPYNISKQIINWAFRELATIPQGTYKLPLKFITQKEVAENYVSKAPNTDFLGHLANFFCSEARITKILPPGSFVPSPKVDSAIIEMIPKNIAVAEYQEIDKKLKFIRQVYTFRRKKVNYALRQLIPSVSEQPNIGNILTKRPEEVTSEEYSTLFALTKT